MEEWLQLIDHHLRLRLHMGAGDIYKLIYQGLLGPEHLISSADKFEAYLQAEFDSINPMMDEALWEPVRPDGNLLRLNLRPFKARGLALDGLVSACLETAQHPWGTSEELRLIWNTVVEQCARKRWPQQDLTDFNSLTALLEQQGYPPIHHSSHYIEVYQPAYRLLAAGFLESSLFA